MNKHVFLSYALTDRDLAKTTIRELRKKGFLENETLEGVDDTRILRLGSNFREEIKERILGSDIVVLIWSRDAARSPWVQYEVGMAKALERPILVAWADKSAPDLPDEIKDNQIIELDAEPA